MEVFPFIYLPIWGKKKNPMKIAWEIPLMMARSTSMNPLESLIMKTWWPLNGIKENQGKKERKDFIVVNKTLVLIQNLKVIISAQI